MDYSFFPSHILSMLPLDFSCLFSHFILWPILWSFILQIFIEDLVYARCHVGSRCRCLSVCLSIYPSIYPSIHPSIHTSIWSVQKASSNAIWKIEIFIKEDTRYKKHCTWDSDASVPFKVGTLWPYTVLPIAISTPIIFSWISSMVWNLFSFKGDFSLGKSQKSQGAKSGL